MNFRNNFVLTSCVVLGAFFVGTTRAALKPTGFPQTFQDVSFSQRNQVKQAGYEPYKDASAYVIPKFIENDDGFYDELCKRDKEECCRRKPDRAGCQPQIDYELYGGDDSECNPKLPKSYRTDQGATISCVPTRNKSVFLGWCTDAARNPADCAMSQTIPVGEKDDKFFWAKWDCVAPAVKRGEQCVCNDPNMDDNCMCSGLGMDPSTAASGTCGCLASDATVQGGKCVCSDPTMDPTQNCVAPLPTPTTCSDPRHMDLNCNCLPLGKASPDNGICRCDDQNLDIDNNCEPEESHYKLVQCRAKSNTMNDYLNGGLGGSIAQYVPWNTLLGSDKLNCGVRNRDSYDKCFTPCQKTGVTGTGVINDELAGIIDPFCTCNWGNTRNGHVWFFADVDDPTMDRAYTKEEVDDVIGKFNAHGDYNPQCDVDNSTWYVIAFEIDSTGSKLKYYKHAEIGH